MTATKKKATKMLQITQFKSGIGYAENQKKVLIGLGLGKIGRTVTRVDHPCHTAGIGFQILPGFSRNRLGIGDY